MANLTVLHDFIHNATGQLITLNNETIGANSISTTIRDRVMKAFYISIASSGILGNIIVLVVMLGLTTLRKKLSSLFIISQSVVDTLTAIFLLLTTVLPSDSRVYKTIFDDIYCRLWVSRLPLWLCIHCSTYNLVTLTLERYLSVVHPIAHKLHLTYKKGKQRVYSHIIIYADTLIDNRK